MAQVFGVCLLPATGEFCYDTLPALGARRNPATGVLETLAPINCFHAPGGAKTDYAFAIDQLQAAHPECQTVALVVAWFGNSTDARSCQIYPSTTYPAGVFETEVSGGWTVVNWQVSGLDQNSPGLIPISQTDGVYTYGGTPSDPSVVRCIQDLKSRGFRVVFYPFILMDCAGKPWRGRIGFAGADVSSAAAAATAAFLGSADPSQFSRDAVNLTVSYSGAPTDFSFRRFILHYANLCAVAGGVDLFLIGSEMRGLEILRGPAWTAAGTLDASGCATWDYPFVAGLSQLAADVRTTFDGAGLTKNLTNYKNLIAYSADWSTWTGWQHVGANGQWPHLDSLFASPNIDLVSFDNYLPLSDWTTGESDLDRVHWTDPRPNSWPPSSATMNGLGLTGAPTLHSPAYLAGNIEGGEHFHWYYADSNNRGRGLDPNGSGQMVSLSEGDRLAQERKAFYPGQQLLGRKQFRWWWANRHQAIYDNGDGKGWTAHGAATQWTPQMKPIIFVEYGFATVDRCTNQPNVFFDPKSTESFTPFWSAWDAADGATYAPRRDDDLANLGLQALYDYWSTSANIPVASTGPMILTPFCCAWNWDARPFPIFPLRGDVWGDGGHWPTGNWIGGKGPYFTALAPASALGLGAYALFPNLSGRSWRVVYRPRFSTRVAQKVSGRETRAARFAGALWDIELRFDLLSATPSVDDLDALRGFFAARLGDVGPFLFAPPDGLGSAVGAWLGVGDGVTSAFALTQSFGGAVEPVQALAAAPTVHANGVAVPEIAFSVQILPATIVFATAPAAGTILTADFSAAHLARFADDDLDLEEFMAGFWRTGVIRIETVRA